MSLKVLCVGPQYPATASRYLFDAFEDVTNGGWVALCGPEYNDHYGVNWGEWAVSSDIKLNKEEPEWDLNKLIDKCTALKGAPDLVLVAEENYRTNIIPTDRLPVVLLSYDGWKNAFDRYHMVQPTLAYTTHPYGVRPEPRDEPDPNWKFLPAACSPYVHRYYNHHSENREYDFVLAATMYGKRPNLCIYLTKKFRVKCGMLATDGYVDAYNHGLTTFHNCCYQEEIKYRFFEAAAMGCVNISDHTRLFSMLGLEPDVHYLPVPITEKGDDPYPDFESIAQHVRAMRNDRVRHRYLSRSAYEWVMAGHTYYHRALAVLTDLGMHAHAASVYGVLDSLEMEI